MYIWSQRMRRVSIDKEVVREEYHPKHGVLKLHKNS